MALPKNVKIIIEDPDSVYQFGHCTSLKQIKPTNEAELAND